MIIRIFKRRKIEFPEYLGENTFFKKPITVLLTVKMYSSAILHQFCLSRAKIALKKNLLDFPIDFFFMMMSLRLEMFFEMPNSLKGNTI